jgi:hypothetical protein
MFIDLELQEMTQLRTQLCNSQSAVSLLLLSVMQNFNSVLCLHHMSCLLASGRFESSATTMMPFPRPRKHNKAQRPDTRITGQHSMHYVKNFNFSTGRIHVY